MARWYEAVRVGMFSPLLVLMFAHIADAQSPQPAPVSRDPACDASRSSRQVMIRQIGFEAQQQGYLAKVQGSASQNVQWITPQEQTLERSRRSWFAVWRGMFDLFD